MEKLNGSLSKNPDLIKFTQNSELTHRMNTQCAPLVSVDVERSFSMYKNILSDKRRSLSEEKLTQLNILYYNKFLE